MTPYISVIIPVYNAEATLKKCVDSVLMQQYADFEVILVDDGSKDGSFQICEEYAREDSRVTVIHKENGGVSSARNRGLEIAKGNWVTFVDSDDYINDTYLVLPEDKDIILQAIGMLWTEKRAKVCLLHALRDAACLMLLLSMVAILFCELHGRSFIGETLSAISASQKT